MCASSARRPIHLPLAAGGCFHFVELLEGFPAARIIRLERNYRSTQNILNARGSGREQSGADGKIAPTRKRAKAQISGISKRRDAQAEAEFRRRSTGAHPE